MNRCCHERLTIVVELCIGMIHIYVIKYILTYIQIMSWYNPNNIMMSYHIIIFQATTMTKFLHVKNRADDGDDGHDDAQSKAGLS
jgi:hypothetical protein